VSYLVTNNVLVGKKLAGPFATTDEAEAARIHCEFITGAPAFVVPNPDDES
jgi:hypothetical protein